jgi:hypothetical protein
VEREDTATNELEALAVLVEDAIGKLGLDPATVRMTPPGYGRAWSLMRGSAAVAIFLKPPKEGEDAPRLRIVAPIVKLADDPSPELYRTLLELNAVGMGGVAFGLLQERVVVIADRRTVDLEPREVEYLIQRVGTLADHYDDRIIARYGGTRVSELA